MEKALPLAWKHKVKVITNMGSANPQAAAKVCVEIARRHGLQGMKIACVTGDDLRPVIDKYMDTEVWETHKPLRELPGEIVSANAYMGVEGILKALDLGADVVITGRVSDPAIFMAPLIHEFGWSLEDWDKLGKGTMVGHLLERSGHRRLLRRARQEGRARRGAPGLPHHRDRRGRLLLRHQGARGRRHGHRGDLFRADLL